MLHTLLIENYAIIDRLDIEFGSGLNIITGETGAGKSILLGAAGMLLGGRSAPMDESKNVVIEAVFDISGYGLLPFFEQNDVDYYPTATLRRVVNQSGKSRAYINDIPVNLSVLKELTAMLLDIHSQHQTMLLGNRSFQTQILDSIADHNDNLLKFSALFDNIRKSERELNEVRERAEKDRGEYDFIKYQFEQLEAAKLVDGEQQILETTQRELSHAAEILDTLKLAAFSMTEDENAINSTLKNITVAIERIKDKYPHAEEIANRLNSSLLELKDIAYDIDTEKERIDIDPEKLSQIDSRLDSIYALQQRHKVHSISELLSLQQAFGERLEQIDNHDEYIVKLDSEIKAMYADAEQLATQISQKRRKSTPKIENYVKTMLAELGMPHARIEITITPSGSLSRDGGDEIRFMFSANRTSQPQPIENVASGGEMSRLMLSLKSLMAQNAKMPTIIFDEIDTGISGEVAHKMGEIINQLAANIQIINITHLPQVASKGSHHFHVYKDDTTQIKKLSADERVTEIAKMLSGSNITAAAIDQAKELLK